MAKDPAFLFYPNDYIGGTMGMTFEEKGAYMELLMMQFNRGHMTKHMIGQTVGQLWDKIQDKFIQDEQGLYYNKRLEEEKIKRKKYTESRRNNKEGINQYTKKKDKKGGHMTGHMENEDENVNKDIKEGFEKFWDTFHTITKRKKEDKEPAFKYWKKLNIKEREKANNNIKPYFECLNDKKYCKKARTYLSDKNFNDEFDIKPKIKQQSFMNGEFKYKDARKQA